jgi:uncharacterized SAM-binding protein YcdF (DUF218 family)
LKNNIFILLGILGILDTIIISLFIDGINVGVLFPGVIGFIVAFIFINKKYRWFDLSINSKRIKKALKLIIIVCISSFIIIESIIVLNIRTDKSTEVDYLMILGAGIRGKEVSLTLQKRMDKGIEYLISNPEAIVIVSGGQGLGEEISEAEAMKNYLVNHGIKENRIIKEEKSTSTMENFKYTKEIIQKDHNEKIKLLMIFTCIDQNFWQKGMDLLHLDCPLRHLGQYCPIVTSESILLF